MITKPKPGFLINPLHPLSRGLVGWWLFNEGGGPTAFDYSGKGNHGILTNMALENVWVGSPYGGALALDGSDDFVSLGTSELLQPTEFFTIMAWVRHIPDTTTDAIYVGGDTDNDHWKFRLTGDNRLQFGQDGGSLRTSSHMLDTNWHQCTVVYRDTSSLIEFYIDGVIVETAGALPLTASGTSKIGKDETANLFRGSISEVRLYNRVVNTTEMHQTYINPYANVLNPQTTFSNNLFASAVALNIGGIGSDLSNIGHIRRRRRMHG